MTTWTSELRSALAGNDRLVAVSVAAVRGSVPREAGARMLVTAERTRGTIGGGHLEFEAIRIARELLAQPGPAASSVARFPLAARLGQCCGGVVTVVFETLTRESTGWLADLDRRLDRDRSVLAARRLGAPADSPPVFAASPGELAAAPANVLPAGPGIPVPGDGLRACIVDVAGESWFVERIEPCRWNVWVFGNGHVGRALVSMLAVLPCRVRWIDSREGDFPAEAPPGVLVEAIDDPVSALRGAPDGACVVVTTHSHDLDFAITEAALVAARFAYVGMIGSLGKRRRFEQRCLARGVDPAVLASLTCPIGQALQAGKHPGEIALAVAAELLAGHGPSATASRARCAVAAPV